MKTTKCLRCGKEWISRVENPVQCPRCKRVDWNVAKEEKENERESFKTIKKR